MDCQRAQDQMDLPWLSQQSIGEDDATVSDQNSTLCRRAKVRMEFACDSNYIDAKSGSCNREYSVVRRSGRPLVELLAWR